MQNQTNLNMVRIEPWAETDLALLYLMNAPEMLKHLGGPESEEKILARHKRYVELSEKGKGRMFRIVLLPELEGIGNIGFWESVWQGETVYEMGWGVLPAYQGRGIAVAAAEAAIASASEVQNIRYIHAFPSIENSASNAICRKLNFSFIAECAFEYPPGNMMHCNDWRLDLAYSRASRGARNEIL